MSAVLRAARTPLRRPPARVLLAAALIAWGVGEAVSLDGAWPVAARIAFVVVVLAPIAAIDRWPWAVAALLLAGVAVHVGEEVMVESVTPLQGIVIAGWVAGAAVAARWRAVAALGAVAAASLLATGALAPFGVLVACALGWAGARAVVGVRRRHAAALAVLRSLQADRATLRSAELDAERRRLARELDAAALFASRRIAAHAERAAALLDVDPDGARALLREIAAATREAIERMRAALAVLRPDERDDDGGADAAPQPDALEAAVALLRSLAVPVALRDGADRREPAVTLAAARTLEAVGASAWRPRRVTVRRGRGGARVVALTGGPAGAEERLALTRIAERARLHGGTVRVRRRPLPWDLRARAVAVRLPALDAGARRGPGAAGVVAGLLAAAATVVDVVTGHSLPVAPGDAPGALATAAAALLTGAAVTAAWTRRAVALVALAVVALARGLPVGFVGLDSTTLPLLALTAFVASLWLHGSRERAAVAVTLAGATVAIVATSWSGPLALSDVAIALASIAIPWLLAVAVRDAADEADRLTALRWATARDDLTAAQQAVEDERRNVARDLHDLVGHGLSLVSVQAWGAERALPGDRRQAAEGIAAIRRVVAGAVAELEQLVAPWDDEPAAAVPDVASLVEEARRAGLPVALDARCGGAPAAPGELLAALGEPQRAAVRRIVQEGLTNVLRHAGAAATTVALRRSADAIAIEVVNGPGAAGARVADGRGAGGRGAGTGTGIAGMRERVEALGGSFAAGPAPDGGFRVSATLPPAPPDAP